MLMMVMPVTNGALPRPQGGRINGIFLFENNNDLLLQVSTGQDIMLCPWLTEEETLYPVGVVARVADVRTQSVLYGNTEMPVIIAELEGRGHGRIRGLKAAGKFLAANVENMNFKASRKEYPVLSGAGWLPEGGYTEFRGKTDIPVTIYGTDVETGKKLTITGNLGGLVEQEQAHTIEHAVIRSLKVYGLCTAKNLNTSIIDETNELKKSVEVSIKYTMPEILGVTASGVCGNPMTNLAQVYLADNFVSGLEAGKTLDESLVKARRATMSQLVDEFGINMNKGIMALQGLKKGMSHDDTPIKWDILKKIILRFPADPWS